MKSQYHQHNNALWLAKMCAYIYVAFEKSITDKNQTVLIILLIDFAAPQAVLLFYDRIQICFSG